MNLSEQYEYRVAIPAKLQGDYSTARLHLRRLITKAHYEGDTLTIVYLLQVLGDVEAMDGNTHEAHDLHQEAINLDPKNPLPMLLYAKALNYVFKQPELSLLKIQELKNVLNSGKWIAGKNDPSIKWYRDEIELITTDIANNNL